MENIKEIQVKIKDLLKLKAQLEADLGNAIVSVINEIGAENPNNIKRINKQCYIINFSQIINKPWSPLYFDWEASAEFVINELDGKPKEDWVKILQSKLESKENYAKFTKVTKDGYGRNITNTIPIDRRFIEKIIEKIS